MVPSTASPNADTLLRPGLPETRRVVDQKVYPSGAFCEGMGSQFPTDFKVSLFRSRCGTSPGDRLPGVSHTCVRVLGRRTTSWSARPPEQVDTVGAERAGGA